MIPRLLDQLQTARQEFSWTQLCSGLLPYSTVLRWQSRAKAGTVLIEKAGPKKKPLLDGPTLQRQIQQLPAGPRRTAGTGPLHQQWKEFISRRDFQDRVAQERQNKIDDMQRITWHRPGAAWSLDTTEYGSDKIKITPLRDLASKYQVPTPLVQSSEDGAQIALYLDSLFRREGPPMFLKRDLGSPLNCLAVDEVLERHRVLPLNSPPGYPRYNGSMERGMRDLKSALDEQRLRAQVKNLPMTLEVELATHKLNHRPLRSLGGLTPCQFYHDPRRRLRLHAAVRHKISREIFEQFWQLAQCMPEKNRHTLNAAWRLIVEDWLRSQHWISLRVNPQQNVSTNSNTFFSQN